MITDRTPPPIPEPLALEPSPELPIAPQHLKLDPVDLDDEIARINRDALDPLVQEAQEDTHYSDRILHVRLPSSAAQGSLTGGDIDDDAYQAEAVGEEAVGGENPTPDQNITENLLKSMGLATREGESVRTHEKLITRDHHRWELSPESSEDYSDRAS